jgi:predicted RNA methylase
MVADELALSLAATTVRPNSRVLDPFCGSGRLLMAASALGATAHGFDVNPLACLISRAKAAAVNVDVIRRLICEAEAAARAAVVMTPLRLRHDRVEWLSELVALELAQIVSWLSDAGLSSDETLVAAIALSGATRDSAWIRKSGWKLHRMDPAARSTHRTSAWSAFIKRLTHYARHSDEHPLNGRVDVTLGSFEHLLPPSDRYDVILTSPPYGDSKTTVQYGAASGICLDVVTRLPGLEHLYLPGGSIDRDCLGSRGDVETGSLRPFWAGKGDGEAAVRVRRFLTHFRTFCLHLQDALATDGTIVMIVGRRSVGGFRVRLDEFAISVMHDLGIRTVGIERRPLSGKTLPRVVNRFGRAADLQQRESGRVKTMDEEIVLTFQH